MVRVKKEIDETSSVPKPAKKKPSRKKKVVKDEQYDEYADEVKKINDRFGKKRKVDEDNSFLKVKSSSKAPTIVHSEQHQNIVGRAEENQISKTYQIEFKSNVIPTFWKCGLCGLRSAVDDLGDLFGPYYIQSDGHLPHFLLKKGTKINCSDLDVWFHGDCILWAPNVYLKGKELKNLEEQLPEFWKNSCHICHVEGAAIPVASGHHVHFPCAKKKGYKMNESLLTCEAV